MYKSIVTFLFSLFLLLFNDIACCQVAPGKYWVAFKDKNNSPYSTNRPEEFLSERSILRRTKQHILFNELDIPVNSLYIDSLQKIGLKIINISKWLNGVIVSTDDITMLNKALNLSFVKEIPLYPVTNQPKNFNKKVVKDKELSIQSVEYGLAQNQINMLNGEYLHNKGFGGENMIIAILDAGYLNANRISSLQQLWIENRILGYQDFVNDGKDIFKESEHGTFVTSVIGGIDTGNFFGSAPKSEFVLVRTENDATEYIIEEYNWVCGAEFADSIGADVINSSLGYTVFDDSRQNHSYKDMDGKTCVSSIGATVASSKGILVVLSAGNDGAKQWFRIGAPADADRILAVGAVDPLGIIADFSSRGPSYDGRIKPDVSAQGSGTIGQRSSGSFVSASGTSFSSPLVAGLSACLWQANPTATNIQVIDAIKISSSFYTNPNEEYGYGIPDFAAADRILKRTLLSEEQPLISFNAYPNPAKDDLALEIFQTKPQKGNLIYITCFDLSGRIVFKEEFNQTEEITLVHLKNIRRLSTGSYRLMLEIVQQVYFLDFIKIE
jgi:serine protease AprX